MKRQLQNSSARKIALLSQAESPPSRLPYWVGPRRWVRKSFAFSPQPGSKSSIFRCRGVLQLPLKAILLCFVIFFSPPAWGNEGRDSFLQNIPNNQKVLLNDFLTFLSQSESGYVLFGDKPMHVETCNLSPLRILSGMNPRTALMLKGRELWEDLNLSLDDKEFLITSFEKDSKCHVVCINRKAFLQAVNQNLSLFRYVLGPTVTPEKLLREMISSKDRFYEVINNDPALLRILLGCGTQNAILNARYANISSFSVNEKNDEFPLISKMLSKTWATMPKKYTKTPSLGFGSIAEEELTLETMLVQSNQIKTFELCEIPHFDCKPDTKETADLLNTYEENRKKIIRSVASKNFLPEILNKLFMNTSGNLEIPCIPQQKGLCLPATKDETIARLCGILHKNIGCDSKKLLRSFIQGVIAREKGQQKPAPSEWKRFKNIGQLQKEVECCKNLEKSNAYFEKLSARSELIALIPNGLYYKVLKNGNEKVATSKINKISFQYSMQILGDKKSKDWGIIKNENPSALIPGIALSLIGMAEGEERLIYIHPQFAYGEESFFPPNITIAAQVRLLSFEEGEQEMQILPAHQIEKRDYKEVLTRFEVLRAEEVFDEGVEFWDSIKKSGNFIDFAAFQRIYNSKNELDPDSAYQDQQFVSDLEYYLISLQNN